MQEAIKRPIQTATFGVDEYEVTRAGRYRPKISPENLRRLWLIKRRTGRPITHLVAEALDYYFRLKDQRGGDQND